MSWSLQWLKMTKNNCWNKIWLLSSMVMCSMESRPKWSKTTSTSIIQLLSQCIKKYSSMLPRTTRPIEGLSKTIASPSAILWTLIPYINRFSWNFFKTIIMSRSKKMKTTLKKSSSCIWASQTAKSSISSFLTPWQNFKSTSSCSLNSKIQPKMVNLGRKPNKWLSPKFTSRTSKTISQG